MKICIIQGSVLGPLLFSTFINKLFFMKRSSDIFNAADGNTICSCGKDLHEVVTTLEIDLSRLL